MMEQPAFDGASLALDYRPTVPARRDHGIAVIGAGEIVDAAHLPAYRLAGYRVVGLFDVNRAKAAEVAARHGVARVYDSLDALLQDPAVEVVDIAIPARHQLEVVRRVVEHKRAVLCQKPLAENFADARTLVEVCRAAGARAAVNQQMRWAPGIRASREVIRRGWLGPLVQGTVQVNVLTPWDHWPWFTSLEGMEFLYHSIHYMDALRYLLGTPEMVFADAARFPGQPWEAATRTTTLFWFAGDLRGLIVDNHNNIAAEDDWYATFRFEGRDGTVKGTFGALYNYPTGREDTLSFFSRRLSHDYWFSPHLEGRWFPHAFMGSMGELMRAVEEEREPENSVADNLATLRMVFGAMRSVAERRVVRLDEIQ
jgi:predicted dehydrogenase